MRQRLIALTFLGTCVLIFFVATAFWTWMLFTGTNDAARDRAEYFAWHWGCALMISLAIWVMYLVQTMCFRQPAKPQSTQGTAPIRW